MKLPRRRNFCIWPPSLPRSRPSPVSQGHKPIRRGRCAGLSPHLPAVLWTSLRAF